MTFGYDRRVPSGSRALPPRESLHETHEKRRKLGLRVGAGVAAIASVAGVVGCSTAGSNSAGAAQGTLSAPAKPTMSFEQPSAAAPSATPESGSLVNLSINNFPFENPDGTINEGLAAFQKAHEIPVEKYAGKDKFPNLFPAVMEQMNGWLSAGVDQKTDQTYTNFTGATGNGGIAKVAGFYDKAYSQTIADGSDNKSFTSFMEKSHTLAADTFVVLRKAMDKTTYKNQFEGTLIPLTTQQADGIVVFEFTLREVNDTGVVKLDGNKQIVLKQFPGSDGKTPVWKVVRIADSAYVG